MKDADILKNVQSLNIARVTNYGDIVLFNRIYQACEYLGFTNKDLIEDKLKQFEQQGLLHVVYDTNCEDLIIGVKRP